MGVTQTNFGYVKQWRGGAMRVELTAGCTAESKHAAIEVGDYGSAQLAKYAAIVAATATSKAAWRAEIEAQHGSAVYDALGEWPQADRDGLFDYCNACRTGGLPL